MDRIPEKNQRTIVNLIYFSFVFSLAYLFGLVFFLKIGIAMQLLIILIVCIAVKFFLLKQLILYILLATVFLVALFVNRYISPFIFHFLERSYILFENIINNLQGKENIAADNVLIFWILLLVLVSLFTAFILFKGKNIYILLPFYFSFFLFYWYSFFDQTFWMIVIFLLAFFVLMGLEKYSKEKIKVENSMDIDFQRLYTPWLQTVATYSVLIVVIALLLPKSYNYIQWPWLQQKVYTAFPIVEELRSYNHFSRGTGGATLFNFSTTGYQEESSRLGGPVILSDKKIMTVHADSSHYLRGNVRQIYTGNAWETIAEPSENFGSRQDFSGLSKEEKDLYYDEVDITITNHAFASTTLFSPYKPEVLNFTEDFWIIVNRDDSLVFPQGVYDGESYSVQAQKPLPFGIQLSRGIDQKIENIEDLDIYLQIPEARITERTKNLVKELVKDKQNDFEKAVAIENHLRENYKYSLYANRVPEGHEFIDYFLFEEQQGYCTYYATSMAILLRLEGIPSRYIEGYLAQDSTEKGIYEVKHENAHAWVEAFIEPVGWMTFEPTPAYNIEPRLENYRPNISVEGSDPNIISANQGRPRDINDTEIVSDQDIGFGGWSPNIESSYNDIPAFFSKNNAIILMGILLLISPVRFLIGLFLYKQQEDKAKKLSNNKRIIYLYKQILKLTELLGYPQKYGETHYEYSQRVAYKFYNYKENGIKEITDIFVKSKYSNSPTSDEDVLELYKYRGILENRLKNHLGKRVYYYRKYVKKRFIV